MGMQPMDLDALYSAPFTAVAWLGGAGFLVAHHRYLLLIDPCLVDGELGLDGFYPSPLRPQDVPPHACVLYTHADSDHMSLETALALPAAVSFYAPMPCIRALAEAGVADQRLHPLRPNRRTSIANMTVRTIAADHSWQEMDPEKYGEPYGAEDCLGYAVTTPDASLLFPGDTRLCAHHLELREEFLLMAADVSEDPYHLGQEAVCRMARKYDKAALLPCHYGTYDAPDALPHNGSLAALREKLGEDARRLLPAVIGKVFVCNERGEWA